MRIQQVLDVYFQGNSFSFESDIDVNMYGSFISEGHAYTFAHESFFSQSGCASEKFEVFNENMETVYRDSCGKRYHYDKEDKFSNKTNKMIKLLSSYVGVLENQS